MYFMFEWQDVYYVRVARKMINVFFAQLDEVTYGF